MYYYNVSFAMKDVKVAGWELRLEHIAECMIHRIIYYIYRDSPIIGGVRGRGLRIHNLQR